MNKVILFACLLVAISSLCSETITNNSLTGAYCKEKKFDESENKTGVDACCLLNLTEKGDGKKPEAKCKPYKKADVLKDVKDNKSKYASYSIDCASNWLSFQLFLIALIFMI